MAVIGGTGVGGDLTRRQAARNLAAALIADRQYVPPGLRQALSDEGVIGQTSGVGQAVGKALSLTGAPQYAQGAIWSLMHPRQRLTSGDSMEVPWVAGRPWFHGSSRSFTEFDPAKADSSSLYGPGHYLTDDRTIANEYASKGDRVARGERFVERAPHLTQTPEWAAFLKQNPGLRGGVAKLGIRDRLSERVARERSLIENMGYRVDDVRREPGKPGVTIEYAASDYGPNVTRYSFEPDKVYDVEAPITSGTTIRLVQALTAGSRTAGHEHAVASRMLRAADEIKRVAVMARERPALRGKPGLGALWRVLEERLGPTHANKVIREAGYDAIAYPGGKATGGRSHNALVVLNQAPLKRGGMPNPKFRGTKR